MWSQISLFTRKAFKKTLSKYFSEDYLKVNWIRKPFSGTSSYELELKESFIDLTQDSSMKDFFNEKSLINFWIGCKTKYPLVFQQALLFLKLLITSYLCESRFSELLYIKSKHRSRISVKEDLRVKISSITPNADILIIDTNFALKIKVYFIR